MAMASLAATDEASLEVRSVYIQNYKSKFFLTADDCIDDGTLNVEQRKEMLDKNRKRHPSQVWLLFKVAYNRFLIVNKRCGWILGVNDGSYAVDKMVQLFPLRDRSESTQTWLILPEAQYGHHCHNVINSNGTLQLTIQSYSIAEHASICQLPPEPSTNFSRHYSQVWEIVQQEKIKNTTFTPTAELQHCKYAGMITQMNTAADVPPPSKTAEYLVGRVVVPFLFVKDSTRMDSFHQAQDSCAYVLSRFVYWHMIYFHDHPGGYEIEDDMTDIMLGLISDNAQEIEDVVGIAVNQDGQFRIQNPAMKTLFSLALARGLRNVVVDTSEATGKSSFTFDHLHEATDTKAVAMWLLEDRYELRDKEWVKLLEFTVRRQGSDSPMNPSFHTFNRKQPESPDYD